jgi:hypothetical protein
VAAATSLVLLTPAAVRLRDLDDIPAVVMTTAMTTMRPMATTSATVFFEQPSHPPPPDERPKLDPPNISLDSFISGYPPDPGSRLSLSEDRVENTFIRMLGMTQKTRDKIVHYEK